MVLFQFQFEGLTNEENKLVLQFGEFLKNIIYNELNTSINKLKIEIRIPYLYKVNWIKWKRRKITVQQIMNTLYNSFKFIKQKDNMCIVNIDTQVLIPNTLTSVSKLIRFFEYGDLKYKGINVFKKLEHKYNWEKLNSLWTMYCLNHIGNVPQSKINGVY